MSKYIESSPEITDDELESLPDAKIAKMDIEISEDEDETYEDQVHRKFNDKIVSSNLNNSTIEISSDSDKESPPKASKWQKFVHSPAKQVIKSEISNTLFPATASSAKVGHVQYIGGVQVKFPFKPYKAQVAVMFKVILGLTRSENCLLESPTGSGKTLALLCSALAWQEKDKERLRKQLESEYFCDGSTAVNSENKSPKHNMENSSTTTDTNIYSFHKKTFGESSIYDSASTTKQLDSPGKNRNGALRPSALPGGRPPAQASGMIDEEEDLVGIRKKNSPEEAPQITSVPRIYYGARTHKQIAQVVKELKVRCPYAANIRAVTLSSREHTCLRPLDKDLYTNKNEMCREVTKPIRDKKKVTESGESSSCLYYDNRKNLFNSNKGDILDLEELVSLGERHRACPYYAARYISANADIVFCPYNYLIDPSIRSSMQIDLSNDIVIIDEAHNIEDVCREAASTTIERSALSSALTELTLVESYSTGAFQSDLNFLVKYLKNWESWFDNHLPLVQDKPMKMNESVFTWEIKHFVDTLNNHNIGLDKYQELCRCTDHLVVRVKEDNLKVMNSIKQHTVTLLESFTNVFGFMFRDGLKHMDDFKPALIKTNINNKRKFTQWNSTNASGQDVMNEQTYSLSLRLICLNPGVIFNTLKLSRCVILASGTLTPSHNITSELDTAFVHTLFADHVISKERIWVGTVSEWNGVKLECTFRHQSSISFQDALADILLHSASVTPGGILVFLSSYTLRDMLINRWKESGTYYEINSLKRIFAESRNARDHHHIMEGYLELCDNYGGGILMAVYRGKVSEGMDFKDQQARLVINIGIPYPNTHEMSVESKMKYNDAHVQDKQLLPSSQWLKVQAYRALNQAAGRCVRHLNDWGAVLFVDQRFNNRYYTEHLSKWLINFLCENHHTSSSLLDSDNDTTLQRFMNKMKVI